MTVNADMVQPWAAGINQATPIGKPFRVAETARAFIENRDAWGPEATGRVKSIAGIAPNSQAELFDPGLVSALEKCFQSRLTQLLEQSFKEIAAVYMEVHGRAPKVAPLFAFLFRFVTAKIFMDRADANGWDKLQDPLEILKAAERQTGLLDRPESDFRRKRILDAAWASVSRSLHFQNLSVPDLAFVAETTFLTDQTRDELGVHSTPAGLAEYIVNQLPWELIPLAERTVLEPFCGHGIFLAKTIERLGQDLDPALGPKKRHDYFRQRLVGVEMDPLSLEICRLVLTLTDYPNNNSWQLHQNDVFRWPEWELRLQASTALLANPPYEAFTKAYRKSVGAAKTKPPAELLHRLLRSPPQLLGLVLPQSFLSDPIYREANRQIAERYESVSLVELPRIFQYANNETIALIASGLRTTGKSIHINYAEVRRDKVQQFFGDWHVSEPRSAEVGVPPAQSGPGFSLRLPPKRSVFFDLRTDLVLGDLAEVRQGVHWVGRSDGKQMSAPRTDVAFDKERKGFHLGAEKMSGNLYQFQLSNFRYLSLRDEDQDPATRANRRPWGKRKAVCNAARLQPLSPWRLVAWADAEGLAFTKQFFAIWPTDGVSEFALAALLASPLANAFSFEHDLDRHNHIETLRALPVPASEHLKPGGEIHILALELQTLIRAKDFTSPPAELEVMEKVLRLDAAVLSAYKLSDALQHSLLKVFTGWRRPLPPPYDRSFTQYFPKHFEEAITLSELIAITIDWERTSSHKTSIIERKIAGKASRHELEQLERLKFLTEARGEYFAPLPLKQLEKVQHELERQRKLEAHH
jgi:hypothetical protein